MITKESKRYKLAVYNKNIEISSKYLRTNITNNINLKKEMLA